MKDQINVGDQNSQKTGQSTSVESSEVLEKRLKYWKLTSIVLFVLLIISLISRVTIYEGSKRNTESETNKDTSMINTATPTPQPQPTIPATQADPTIGKSYGVFYPYSEGITINNNLPTIIGKVAQKSDIYLDTKFGLEKSPVSGEDEYFLRFIPGRVKNLKVKIDDIAVKAVFGTPQYPTVLCKNRNLNPDGTSSYDPKTGEKSPPDDIFNLESDCLTNKQSELPPVVFFTKSETPLSKGKHTLTIQGNDNYQTMTFFVDTEYHLTTQDIYVVDKTSEYYFLKQYPLIAGDNCSEGYYYDSNYLKVPLPSFNNSNLYYGISFPQTKAELEDTTRRKIQIAFDSERFDLFFPQSSTFYEGKSFYDRNNRLSDYHQLFLPKDQLVFPDGSKATYVDDSVFFSGGTYLNGYFEIYPIDMTGGEYKGFSIPWVISGSSSCDG
ncbi:hypothetical protein KJ664_01700 [Patescibacteria group bacterium]|nr:hypothetical protein [Patescibacteria group bacterium]MBU4381335.1 hypothetical protein [Patescibacteria group bacterium]